MQPTPRTSALRPPSRARPRRLGARVAEAACVSASVPQSLKVIYSEDPAALQAVADLLLLQEQARSMVCPNSLTAEESGASLSTHTCGVLMHSGRAGDELLARACTGSAVWADVWGEALTPSASPEFTTSLS